MSSNRGVQPDNGFKPEQAFDELNRRKGPEELKLRRQAALRAAVQGLEKHVFVPAFPEVQNYALEQKQSPYRPDTVPTYTKAEVASAERDHVQMGQNASDTIQGLQYDRPTVPGTQEASAAVDSQQAHMESIQQEVARLRAQQDQAQLTNDNFTVTG